MQTQERGSAPGRACARAHLVTRAAPWRAPAPGTRESGPLRRRRAWRTRAPSSRARPARCLGPRTSATARTPGKRECRANHKQTNKQTPRESRGTAPGATRALLARSWGAAAAPAGGGTPGASSATPPWPAARARACREGGGAGCVCGKGVASPVRVARGLGRHERRRHGMRRTRARCACRGEGQAVVPHGKRLRSRQQRVGRMGALPRAQRAMSGCQQQARTRAPARARARLGTHQLLPRDAVALHLPPRDPIIKVRDHRRRHAAVRRARAVRPLSRAAAAAAAAAAVGAAAGPLRLGGRRRAARGVGAREKLLQRRRAGRVAGDDGDAGSALVRYHARGHQQRRDGPGIPGIGLDWIGVAGAWGQRLSSS